MRSSQAVLKVTLSLMFVARPLSEYYPHEITLPFHKVLFISSDAGAVWSRGLSHWRRSSVNFGGKTFLPEHYVWKINKIFEFYVIFNRKNARILHDNCPIIFLSTIFECMCPRLMPASPAPMARLLVIVSGGVAVCWPVYRHCVVWRADGRHSVVCSDA